MPLFCWFHHFLDSRAETCQIFCWYFGPNDDTKGHFEINWPLSDNSKFWFHFASLLTCQISNEMVFHNSKIGTGISVDETHHID